jgi:lipoteichoic acid synthase
MQTSDNNSFTLFQGINEIIYLLILFKIVLFHTFSTTTLSSGVFSTSLGFLLIFYAFSYFFRNKLRLLYSIVINLIITVILLSNNLYLDYFSSPITISTFYQTNNLSGLGDSILFLVQLKYVLFFIDLILFPVLIFRKRFIYRKPRRIIAGFIPFFILGLMGLLLKPVKLLYIDKVDNPLQAYDTIDVVVQYGLLGHHVIDAFYHIQDINFSLSASAKSTIKDQLNQKQVPSRENEFKHLGKQKNLIMIQIESLQNFVLNQKVSGQEITPTLNKLIKNSIYFPNFYAQTIGGNSSDAEFLTQTSLFPLKSGSVFFRYPTNKYHSIATTLQEKGYSTLAVHADESTFWNRNNMYPSLGFDEYVSIEQFPQKELIGMGVGDKEMFSETAKLLKQQSTPFYSFIITLTNHIPYELPEDKHTLSLPDELKDTLLGNYFQTVRYTDESLSVFLDKLTEEELLKDSIIVLYGDHNGIFESDKGMLEDFLIKKKISSEEWYRKYATVPLLIYNPSIKGEVIQTIGGQIDVYPTISSIMGVSPSNGLGLNLLTQSSGDVIIPSGGYVDTPLYITKDKINKGLSPSQEHLIHVSNLIIKGDYYRMKE